MASDNDWRLNASDCKRTKGSVAKVGGDKVNENLLFASLFAYEAKE